MEGSGEQSRSDKPLKNNTTMKTKSKSDLRNEAEPICGCVHTPGPWKALISGATRAISTTNEAPKQATICRLFTECASFKHGEPEANARLIASAPDLLSAMESIAALEPSIMSKHAEEGFRYHTDEDAYRIHLAGLINQARAIARAAIAKATGGNAS
jgi:hypothetical protein